MERLLDQAQTLLMELGPSVLAAIVIFVVGRWIAKIITKLVSRVATKANVDPILVKFMGSVTYAVLLMLVIISALGKLGINTTSFVAVVGAAGLAIGFAFQGTLGNLASGVMLIFFRPFKAGDYIEAGGTAGTVEEVQIFATILRTPDNKRIIIPNGTIVGGNITNYSANPTSAWTWCSASATGTTSGSPRHCSRRSCRNIHWCLPTRRRPWPCRSWPTAASTSWCAPG